MDEKKERERDLLMFTLGNQYLSPPPLLLQRALVSRALMSTPHGRGATQNPIHVCHNYRLPRPVYIHKRNTPPAWYQVKMISAQDPTIYVLYLPGKK